MKTIKRLDKDYKILQKGCIATYGGGTTSGKSVHLTSTLSKNSMNNFTMNVTIKGRSSQTWNNYGVRVYAHVGGSKYLLGTSYIKNGTGSPGSFSTTFNIGSNTSCYATCICAHCEDGASNDREKWTNQTSADIAYYESPATPPTNVVLTLSNYGIAEGNVVANTTYTCSHPTGITEFQYAYRTDGGPWVYLPWQTSSQYVCNVTDIKRGAFFEFDAIVRNGAGNSAWSGYKSVRSNSLPNKPTGLSFSDARPVNNVTLSWNAASDPDNQSIGYNVYIKKNNGGWIHLGTTSSTSMSFNTSSDAQGTAYNFKVDAYDSLGANVSSDQSGVFHRATQPAGEQVTLNKSGIIEGDVTATATYSCVHPAGTVEYQFSYYHDGIGWQDQAWKTGNTFTINTSSKRGVSWGFRTRIRNGAGTSNWSSEKSVRSNRVPNAATSLKHSPAYPVREINFSWGVASDPDGHSVTYNVYVSKNNGAYSLIASSLSSTTFKYSIANDAENTKYRFKVESKDSFNVTTMSGESAQFFKPISPTKPSYTLPAKSIQEGTFEVKWNPSNFNSLKGHYVVEKKVNSGNWTIENSKTTLASFSYNIVNINRGDAIQFRTKAVNEAGQESDWATSNVVNRNRVPNGVTNIQPSDTYVANVITFSWNAATDPDGHSVKYNIYVSKNGGSYISLGTTTNTSYKWSIPSSDQGETTYRLKVEIVDSLGAMTTTIGPEIKKPTPPTTPSNLGPSSGYYEGSINFTWTASNFFGQKGEYLLNIYVDGVLKTSPKSSTNSYNYNLSGIPRGAKLSFNVKAKNVFDQESAVVASTNNMYHNRIPDAPTIVLPLNNKSVNTRNPKIVIKSNKEHDSQSVSIKVKYNGAIYSSNSHSQYFSKTTLGNDEYLIFKHTDMLPTGVNTIEAYSNDGLIDSPKTSISMTTNNNVASVLSESYIVRATFTDRSSALNKTLEAYGISPIYIPDLNYIQGSLLRELSTNIISLGNKIDSYHANNKFKYNFTFSTIVDNSTIIEKYHFNEISNAINNI